MRARWEVGFLLLLLTGCSLHEGVYRVDFGAPPQVLRVRASGLLEHEGRYLVDFRGSEDGPVDLFGGGLEPGETPREAVRREWREELGIEPEVGALRMVVQRFFNHGSVAVSQLDLVFEIRAAPTDEMQPVPGHTPRWLSLEELRALEGRPPGLFERLPLPPKGIQYVEEEAP